MNYKRFSRFFCLAAACCVILAGAAAPLTAYAAEDDGSAALDVAQDTRTLSGTWRWNDEIDFSSLSGSGEIDLRFDVSPAFDLDMDTGLVYFSAGSFSMIGLAVDLSVSSSDGVTTGPSISYVSVDGDSTALAYWDISSENPEESSEIALYDGWSGAAFQILLLQALMEVENPNFDILIGWGQTIRFPYAQEVPVEFYDWFTANAVKQVSPMETFLDNFTAPISGIWSVVTDVSDTIVSTPLLLLAFCFAFLGMCVSIFGRILSRS